MVNKQRNFKANILPRTLSASFAGMRAGGALAADCVLQGVLGRGPDDADCDFARREAR